MRTGVRTWVCLVGVGPRLLETSQCCSALFCNVWGGSVSTVLSLQGARDFQGSWIVEHVDTKP